MQCKIIIIKIIILEHFSKQGYKVPHKIKITVKKIELKCEEGKNKTTIITEENIKGEKPPPDKSEL